MNIHMKSLQLNRLSTIFTILTTLLLSACAGKDLIVDYHKRIPLVEKENTDGTFIQDGQSANYTYYFSENTLKIEGKVYGKPNVITLGIQALLLDKDGRVLQEQPLYYSGYRAYDSTIDKRTKFQKTIEVPPGTSNLSFDFSVEYRYRSD